MARHLPEYGYANIGENSIFLEYQNGYQNENWDRRDGILDAAIKDLNGDEVEDLLVFRFGHWDGDPMEGDALGNQEGRRIILEGENRLIAELYSMDENGEIFLAGRQALGSYSGLTGSRKSTERPICIQRAIRMLCLQMVFIWAMIFTSIQKTEPSGPA